MRIVLALLLIAAATRASVPTDSPDGVVGTFYDWYLMQPRDGSVNIALTPVKPLFDPALFAAIAKGCPVNPLSDDPFLAGNADARSVTLGTPVAKNGGYEISVKTVVPDSRETSHLKAIVRRDAQGRYLISDFAYDVPPPNTLRREIEMSLPLLPKIGGCRRPPYVPPAAVARLSAWAAAQTVKPGTVAAIGVPAQLAGVPASGPARVARLSDGSTCVLVVTQLEFHDNFEGLVTCTRRLTPSELPVTDSGRLYISIPGYGAFEELYVKRNRDGKTFDVYFDLN